MSFSKFSKFLGVGIILCGVIAYSALASAAQLSDLIKQTPKLYMPSQLIPGVETTFTIQAKAGKTVHLLLSAQDSGYKLPDGTALAIGTPLVAEKAIVPLSGIVALKVKIPMDAEDQDQQFVAAYQSDEAGNNPEPIQLIDSSGQAAKINAIAVGKEADSGSTLIVPGGDPTMTNLFRTVSTLNDIGHDPRKKQLLDDGAINRDRDIDRVLPSAIPTK